MDLNLLYIEKLQNIPLEISTFHLFYYAGELIILTYVIKIIFFINALKCSFY